MRTCVFALILVLPLLVACQGSRLPVPGAARAPASTQPAVQPGPRTPTTFDRVTNKNVRLTPRDLAPVDAWLGARNTQWIIGETVDIYASKEYFASALTFNAKPGLVKKQESVYQGDSVITLTYIGAKHATSAMRAPRVFVGKDQEGRGLSVSARRMLRIRMAKTRDPSRPVQLRIVANGKAVQGKHEEVLRRGQRLELGGALRRSQGRWYWIPVHR